MNDEIVVTPKDNGHMDVEVKPSEAGVVQEFTPLSGMMDITEPSKEDSEKLSTVWDYFKGENKSNAEILYAIKSLENRMAAPSLNESRLNKVYQWVRVRKDIESNEKLLNSL